MSFYTALSNATWNNLANEIHTAHAEVLAQWAKKQQSFFLQQFAKSGFLHSALNTLLEIYWDKKNPKKKEAKPQHKIKIQKQRSKDKKSWNPCTKVYKHSNIMIKDKNKFMWHSKVQNKREGMKKNNQAEIQEGNKK